VLLSFILHSMRIHSPLLPKEQETHPETYTETPPNQGEAEVSLKLFHWDTDPYFLWQANTFLPFESAV